MLVFDVGVEGGVTEVLFAAATVVNPAIFVLFAPSSLIFVEKCAHFSLHLDIEQGFVQRVAVFRVIVYLLENV